MEKLLQEIINKQNRVIDEQRELIDTLKRTITQNRRGAARRIRASQHRD